jgi:hypothetical protein
MRLVIFALGALLAFTWSQPLHGRPPPIAPSADTSGVLRDWAAFVSERYPAGGPSENLEDTLRDQGFRIRDAEDLMTHAQIRHATHAWREGDCAAVVTVDWTIDARGAARDVWGATGLGCGF